MREEPTVRDFKTTIQVNDQDMDLVFDLNVMEEIQTEYGSMGQWGDLTAPEPDEIVDPKTGAVTLIQRKEPDVHAVIFGFRAMLNEGIDIANEDGKNRPMLTHKQAGRIVTALGLAAAAQKLEETVTKSTAGLDEKNV